MNWEAARLGLVDELMKIADFNLRGLSPSTVIEKSQPPPPMETPGFDKARDILSRASQIKTAASRHVQRALPTTPGIGKLTHQGDNSTNEKAKSVAGYGLAGLGGGRAIAEFAHGPKVPNAAAFHRNKWYGSAGGLAAGAGYGLYRAHQKAQMAKKGTIIKTATLTSPAMALKASKQVGKIRVAPSAAGPSTTTQIRGQLIGKKGVP